MIKILQKTSARVALVQLPLMPADSTRAHTNLHTRANTQARGRTLTLAAR